MTNCDFCREECIINYGNIMYDRRIVRGSTYGRKVVTNVSSDRHKTSYAA